MSGTAMCIYCGETITYGRSNGADMEAAHKTLMEHDQQCPKNPLVVRIKRADDRAERQRRLEAQLQGEINELEAKCDHLDACLETLRQTGNRIINYGEKPEQWMDAVGRIARGEHP